MSQIITAYHDDYKDLDLSFKIHPLYSDIVPSIELDAIRNSVRNILMTKPGERPFKPRFGCNLSDLLFENFSPMIEMIVKSTVKDALALHEPRIKVIDVTTSLSPDNNSMDVFIEAEIVNYQREVEIKLTLERIR